MEYPSDPIAGFTVGTEIPLPHPPSAQKDRAVDSYYYYYYYEVPTMFITFEWITLLVEF